MALPPRHGLSLCAGGGGLDMGLGLAEPGFATACYVEIEEYPRSTLIAGQRAGYLHTAPIWDDLKRFSGIPWRGQIDTLLAGYPCQPFSQAGQRKGADDPRHLWPDIARIVRELGDGLRWLFLENVAGHVTLGLETVLRDLREMGFTPAAGIFSAEETGATHERQRVFIVAHRNTDADAGRLEQGRSGRSARGGTRDSAEWQRLRAGVGGGSIGGDGTLAHRASIGEREPHDEAGTVARERSRGTVGGRGLRSAGELDHPASARSAGARRGPDQRGDGNERGKPMFGDGRDELADASGPGPQGRERRGPSGERHGAAAHGSVAELRGAPLHPPGPSDLPGWRAVLARAPELAPAVSLGDLATFARYFAALVEAGELDQATAESRLCLLSDGLSNRARILRLLGNAVHPLTAAYAWRTLSAAHGLGAVNFTGRKDG